MLLALIVLSLPAASWIGAAMTAGTLRSFWVRLLVVTLWAFALVAFGAALYSFAINCMPEVHDDEFLGAGAQARTVLYYIGWPSAGLVMACTGYMARVSATEIRWAMALGVTAGLICLGVVELVVGAPLFQECIPSPVI